MWRFLQYFLRAYGGWQVVWNSKMREEVLAQMEAARDNPDKAGTAQGFRFEALQVAHAMIEIISLAI